MKPKYDTITRQVRETDSVAKTVKVVLGDPTAVARTYNQKFTSVANKVKQNIQLTGAAMIPAFARLVDVVVVSTEAWTGSAGVETGLSVEIGTSSGGTEIAVGAGVDALGDINQPALAGAFITAVSKVATSIWISATPTVNNFSQFTDGKLTVYVTYIDNGAA